jgi:hypothetical protein
MIELYMKYKLFLAKKVIIVLDIKTDRRDKGRQGKARN